MSLEGEPLGKKLLWSLKLSNSINQLAQLTNRGPNKTLHAITCLFCSIFGEFLFDKKQSLRLPVSIKEGKGVVNHFPSSQFSAQSFPHYVLNTAILCKYFCHLTKRSVCISRKRIVVIAIWRERIKQPQSCLPPFPLSRLATLETGSN